MEQQVSDLLQRLEIQPVPQVRQCYNRDYETVTTVTKTRCRKILLEKRKWAGREHLQPIFHFAFPVFLVLKSLSHFS